MRGYVIVRTSDGKYVSMPGSGRSYTDKLPKAAIYSTREDAAKVVCPGNEHVVSVDAAFEAERNYRKRGRV